MVDFKKHFSLEIEKRELDVVVKGAMPVAEIEKYRNEALEVIKKNITIDGFRKGGAPDEMIIQKVGAFEVWRNALFLAVQKNIVEILATTECICIGQPSLSLDSIGLNEKGSFTITVERYPDVFLPEYKNIAKEVGSLPPFVLDEQEIEKSLLDLRKNIYMNEHKDICKTIDDVPQEIPELTDDQVKKISPQHKTVKEFLTYFRSVFEQNKRHQRKSERRIAMIKKIIEGTKVTISEKIIDQELDAGVESIKKDAERMGTTYEKFLEHQKKDEKAFREDLKPTAIEKIKTQMILNEISKKENIIFKDTEKIDAEAKRIQERNKTLSENQAKILAESIYTNEEVFLFLEHIADGNEK